MGTQTRGAAKPAYRQTIVSMVPAPPGWRALCVGWEDDSGGFLWTDDVAVWALVEETSDGYRSVEGLVVGEVGLESAEGYTDQFLRYLSPGQTHEDFAAAIADRQQEIRSERTKRRTSTTAPRPPQPRTPVEALGLEQPEAAS